MKKLLKVILFALILVVSGCGDDPASPPNSTIEWGPVIVEIQTEGVWEMVVASATHQGTASIPLSKADFSGSGNGKIEVVTAISYQGHPTQTCVSLRIQDKHVDDDRLLKVYPPATVWIDGWLMINYKGETFLGDWNTYPEWRGSGTGCDKD